MTTIIDKDDEVRFVNPFQMSHADCKKLVESYIGKFGCHIDWQSYKIFANDTKEEVGTIQGYGFNGNGLFLRYTQAKPIEFIKFEMTIEA